MEASTMSYDLEEARIIHWAGNMAAKRLLLQAPDGMKVCLRKLAEVLEDKGFEVIISASHAWGGCDVAVEEMETLRCDALIHIGHHGPVRFTPPRNVLFVAGKAGVSVDQVVDKAADVLNKEGLRKVGIATNVQHLHQLPRVKAILSERGIDGLTARSSNFGMPEGLVIGCDVQAAQRLVDQADGFLVIGGGKFHALGVALATGRRTFAADPYMNTVIDVSGEAKRIIAVRLAHLSSALDVREAIIVASTKPGQRLDSEKLAHLQLKLKERGVRVRVVAFNDVSRENLDDLGAAELYINTACPRLATDDPHLFPAPVVNYRELLHVLEGGLEAYDPTLSVTL